MTNKPNYTFVNYLFAWAVHLFTASAAFVGVLTLLKIYQQEYIHALCLMGVTVAIDALDGTFARRMRVKLILPQIDGALLDNMVDFVNYVVTPCFFLLVKPGMLPPSMAIPIIAGITITSCYQFCQSDAKTPDHFFKGFPCYWNFAIFYMVIFNTAMDTNAIILSILCVLIFIPIKYVYPSRIDYLTESKSLKILMHACSACFGVSSAFILWNFPQHHPIWLGVSFSYIVLYLTLSIYRTFSPLIKARMHANDKSV